MKEQGFTLVETLIVLAILGILALIATPAITDLKEKSDENAHKSLNDSIILAAKNYVVDNKYELKNSCGSSLSCTATECDTANIATISLNQLVASGYLKEKIINPLTNKEVANMEQAVLAIFDCNSNSFDFDFELDE